MAESEKMIEAARSRVVERSQSSIELKPEDVLAKLEMRTREEYFNGFRDYHGPKGDELYNES